MNWMVQVHFKEGLFMDIVNEEQTEVPHTQHDLSVKRMENNNEVMYVYFLSRFIAYTKNLRVSSTR
jgi:hypothetical protein